MSEQIPARSCSTPRATSGCARCRTARSRSASRIMRNPHSAIWCSSKCRRSIASSPPGEACAVVESVKAASDVYSPVAGRVVARNEELAQKPELLNSDPYGAGWLMRIELDTQERGSARACCARRRVRSSSSRNPSRTPPCRSFRIPPTTSRTCSRSSARPRSTLCSTRFPAALKAKPLDGVPPALCEMDVARLVTERAAGDGRLLNFIGAGAYEHHIPAPVWAIATRGEFYSAYTPYQAEASQGTLAAHLRISVDDLRPHRHGSRERLAVRRRLGARGGVPHGGALAPRLDVAPHPHAAHRQSDVPQGWRSRSPAIKAWNSRRWISSAARGSTSLDALEARRGEDYRRAGGAAAEFLRQPGGGRSRSPTGRMRTRCW